MSDDKMIDFSEPLPPETPDGEWTACASVKFETPARRTKNGEGDEYVFIEFALTEAHTGGNEEFVGSKVSKIFLPKSQGNPKAFRMFMQEVKELAKVFDVAPPRLSAAEVGTLEAWRPFLTECAGKSVKIYTQNKADKQGTMRCNVHFSAPKSGGLKPPSE